MFPVRGSVRSVRPPIATLSLIGLNVFAFLLELELSPARLEAVVYALGVVPAREIRALTEAPWAIHLWLLPVLTSMFLHGGWGHLIGNMLFLWVFGDGVEHRVGHARFLGFYLLGGALASQAQVVFSPLSMMPTVGASGAIAAVLGAYLRLYPTAMVALFVFPFPMLFEVPAVLFLGLWFLQQLFFGTVGALSPVAGETGGVAWWAHAGGFVAGLALVRALAPPRLPPGERPPRAVTGAPPRDLLE